MIKLDDIFLPNTEFCPYHLVHEGFFTGGGSWSPDKCPICRTDDFILWKQMSHEQKVKAKELFSEYWKAYRSSKEYFTEEIDMTDYSKIKIINGINSIFKRKYCVTYMVNFGSMSLCDEEYICYAYCKFHAWRMFLRDKLDYPHHYADRSYLGSYWRMRKDIKRIRKENINASTCENV